MITREQYLNRECTHREYYAQFVGGYVRRHMLSLFTLDELREEFNEESDKYNVIPLYKWDRIFSLHQFADQLRLRGDYVTQANLVCIAREAARQALEEMG